MSVEVANMMSAQRVPTFNRIRPVDYWAWRRQGTCAKSTEIKAELVHWYRNVQSLLFVARRYLSASLLNRAILKRAAGVYAPSIAHKLRCLL